nr:G protein-coupled receptor [Proales similis]
MIGVLKELEKSLGWYSLAITVIGTLMGLVSIRICCRLRKTVTFVFLAFLSANNIVSLYFWNLNIFARHQLGFSLPELSLPVCRIGTYIQLSTLQLSAWFLVATSVEQYLSVRVNHWRTLHFKMPQAIRVSLLLMAVAFLLNSHMLVTYGVQRQEANQTVTYCYAHVDLPEARPTFVWNVVHIWLYSILPTILLLLINCLFVRETRKRIENLNQSRLQVANANAPLCARRVRARGPYRFTTLNRTVMSLTALFFLMTLPCSMIMFFFGKLVEFKIDLMVISYLGELSFTYQAFTFLIIFLSNRRFRKEFLSVMGILVE